MEIILERVGKEISCPHCSYKLKYSWLSLIDKNWIGVYSSDGNVVLASNELMKSATEEKTLENNISDYEKKRNFDKPYKFSFRNEIRCPNCKHSLTSRHSENF